MMRTVVILATAASYFASAPLAGQIDRPPVARLGMLSDTESFTNPISPQDWLAAFRAGLNDSGYTEGKNIAFEFRNADRDPQRLAKYAAELAVMKVDIIVASSTTAAKAVKAVTQTVPIVFWGAEPISSGLVQNLDHPGGNLTGVTANEEQQTEFLAQLEEVVPRLDHLAILFNPNYAPVPGLVKYAEQGARALRLSPHFVKVATPEDLPQAFVEMKRNACRAVLVLNHGMFFRERSKLAELAIENRIALSTPYLRNAEAGALIAHEPDFDQVWRMNASYVDKILTGANPGDLPVQKVSFRYAINLKTAKALGLTIPESILARAAVVIPDSPLARDSNSAAPPQNPFVGKWKLNLTKSKIAGPDGIRSVPLAKSIVTYEAIGDQMKISDDDTDTNGQSVHMEWTGKFDGKDYPVSGDASADSWSFEEIDDHTLVLTTKKDGKVMASRRATVSADGRTRTLTGTRTDGNGKIITVTAVYEKE